MSSPNPSNSKRNPKRVSRATLERLAEASAQKNGRLSSASDPRRLQPVATPPNGLYDGAGGLDDTFGSSASVPGIGQANGFDNSVGNRFQEMEHPRQNTQRPDIVGNMALHAAASKISKDSLTVYSQAGAGLGNFHLIARSNANMEMPQSEKVLKQAAIISTSTTSNHPVASNGLLQQSGIYAQDITEGLHPDPEDSDGDTEDEDSQQANAETVSKANSKKVAKEKQEWEEKYVLSGFPHPKDDPPAEEDLRSLCRTHPNHLNKRRLDPFIQWYWTDMNIIEGMHDNTITRMQNEIPGCKNFRETLSRRLRSRRKALGPEGVARLRAANPMHPAHKRGTSKQSGMLDAEKYAARMEVEKQKKEEKAAAKAEAKAQQKASRIAILTDTSVRAQGMDEGPEVRQDEDIAASYASSTGAAFATAKTAATSNEPQFDRAEHLIRDSRAARASHIQTAADTAIIASAPTILKRLHTAEFEKGEPPKRARADVPPQENANVAISATANSPELRVPGSENFSPWYMKNNNLMEPESTPGIRKYLMPDTAEERRALRESVPNLTERRIWSRAYGRWIIEVLDKHGDVVDEYLEKHYDGCPCCPER